MTDHCSIMQVLQVVYYPPGLEYAIFGSFSEGTATYSMRSDIDQVLIYDELSVVTDVC